MAQLIALTIGNTLIKPPKGIPTGGIEVGGAAQQVLQFGVQAFFFVAGVLAVIFILIAAIRYIAANGDKTKVASARSMIVYALIGLIIVLASFTIMGVLGNFLGFSLLPHATKPVSCIGRDCLLP